jgi:hypothetical protein
MTSTTLKPPTRNWEYYEKKFRQLFEEFARDVLVDQADHYMNMVGFTPVSDAPLSKDPHEGWEEEGAHVIVYRYRNDQNMELDFRFSFNPLAGLSFEVDFEEAGMLMYSGPYDEIDSDLWESIMDSIEDGEDEIAKQRERERFKVVK